MPTQVLGLDDAGKWLVMIAKNEGVDHPVVSRMAISRSLLGLTSIDEWCISVRKKKMSQLFLVHEMYVAAELRVESFAATNSY